MSSRFLTQDEDSVLTLRQALVAATSSIIWPFRAATSKPAQRAYLTSILLFLGSSILLGLAIIAYTLFYWSYIPRISFEKPLYLQFDYIPNNSNPDTTTVVNSNAIVPQHPYATIPIYPDFVSAQRYDISIELTFPRTRANREAGNFMLEATLLAPETVIDTIKQGLTPGDVSEQDRMLAVSRRPAMLKYRSWVVEALWKLTELHWYLLKIREETEVLTVSLFEGIEFAKGWRNVPSTMRVELQSTHRMQIYSAKALFRARFRGLRWVMYNHRILSAVVFVAAFWVTELVFAGITWATFSYYFGDNSSEATAKKEGNGGAGAKAESVDENDFVLSDTDRTFPTSSKQTPLRYESPRVKREDDRDEPVMLPEHSTRATEADDEDDEDILSFHDSGIGTSLESSGSRLDGVRRRRSRTSLNAQRK